jgi:hypothetical protein
MLTRSAAGAEGAVDAAAQANSPVANTSGLADTLFGALPKDLMTESKANGSVVISIKGDWTRVFAADE